MIRAAVDFGSTAGQPKLGWILLTVGILSFMGALWAQQRWEAQSREESRVRQLAADEDRRRQLPVRHVEPTPGERRMQTARVELLRPWLATLRVIEDATTDPIYLRSLVVEPASGTVRIEAEAPSFDHALAYVQMLDQGGVLAPASIVSHEEAPDPAIAQTIVRFNAVTRWAQR
jgi:hypothetical protein